MRKVLIILILIFLLSCSERNKSGIKQTNADSTAFFLKQWAELNKQMGSNSFFIDHLIQYPTQAVIRGGISQLKKEREEELNHLKSIDEPDISGAKLNYDCFRLTFKAGWIGTNFIIRVENIDEQAKLIFKEIKLMDSDKDSIINNFSKSISKEEWLKLLSLIDNSFFWNLSPDWKINGGYDCNCWTLEGAKHQFYFNENKKVFYSAYHKFYDCCGMDNDNSYYKVCHYLMKLAGKIEESK